MWLCRPPPPRQACIDENAEMVQFLVESGSEVNRGDNEGWTPLHAAASCGFIQITKWALIITTLTLYWQPGLFSKSAILVNLTVDILQDIAVHSYIHVREWSNSVFYTLCDCILIGFLFIKDTWSSTALTSGQWTVRESFLWTWPQKMPWRDFSRAKSKNKVRNTMLHLHPR